MKTPKRRLLSFIFACLCLLRLPFYIDFERSCGSCMFLMGAEKIMAVKPRRVNCPQTISPPASLSLSDLSFEPLSTILNSYILNSDVFFCSRNPGRDLF